MLYICELYFTDGQVYYYLSCKSEGVLRKLNLPRQSASKTNNRSRKTIEKTGEY